MFFVELASWLIFSLLLVGAHVRLSPRAHPHLALTLGTGAMWGVSGGLLGTVIQFERWEMTGGYDTLSLLLCGVATLSFLMLEWAGGHQHPLVRH
jgi:hypothetical protein